MKIGQSYCVSAMALFVYPLVTLLHWSQKHCAAASQITVFGISTVFLLTLFMRFFNFNVYGE